MNVEVLTSITDYFILLICWRFLSAIFKDAIYNNLTPITEQFLKTLITLLECGENMGKSTSNHLTRPWSLGHNIKCIVFAQMKQIQLLHKGTVSCLLVNIHNTAIRSLTSIALFKIDVNPVHKVHSTHLTSV